jgi:hypothetical protein
MLGRNRIPAKLSRQRPPTGCELLAQPAVARQPLDRSDQPQRIPRRHKQDVLAID